MIRRTVTNRFGPVASQFFYPMIQGFFQSRNNKVIWGNAHGGILLSRVLIALSTFVEHSGNHPGTPVLAVDLFEFAWPFLEADNAEVRQAVLVALAMSFDALPAEYTLSIAMSEKRCFEILAQIVSNDNDDKCRSMALSILKEMQSMIIR